MCLVFWFLVGSSNGTQPIGSSIERSRFVVSSRFPTFPAMVNIGAQLSRHTRWHELIESSPLWWPLEKLRNVHKSTGVDLSPQLDASDQGYINSAMWLIGWGQRLPTERLGRELVLARRDLDILQEKVDLIRQQHPDATEAAMQVGDHMSADLRVSYWHPNGFDQQFDFDVRFVINEQGDENIVGQVWGDNQGAQELPAMVVVIGITDGNVEIAHNVNNVDLARVAASRLENVGFIRQLEPSIALASFEGHPMVDISSRALSLMELAVVNNGLGADADTIASDGNGNDRDDLDDVDFGLGVYISLLE